MAMNPSPIDRAKDAYQDGNRIIVGTPLFKLGDRVYVDKDRLGTVLEDCAAVWVMRDGESFYSAHNRSQVRFANPVPQVPAMATSGASGQNLEADRACSNHGLCDEGLAGGSNPAALDFRSVIDRRVDG